MSDSILDGLEPFEWNNEEVAALESTLEIIGQVIGIYSSLLWEERQKSEPDLGRIGQLTDARREAVQTQERLPSEPQTVREVQETYAEKLKALRAN